MAATSDRGLYFMAAGNSSKNRLKTLDKSWTVNQLRDFVPKNVLEQLEKHFPENAPIYAWGANDSKHIERVRPSDLVVDVKNKVVMNVFDFGFWYHARDTKLQDVFGWDEEKPHSERRPYYYIYFLKNPKKPRNYQKEFYQRAFSLMSNQNWLVGQRYFDTLEISKALDRTNTRDVFEFLGIRAAQVSAKSENDARVLTPPVILTPVEHRLTAPPSRIEIPIPHKPVTVELIQQGENRIPIPEWLQGVASQINVLKKDPLHQEREHEAIVANFFRELGYSDTTEIKYQRGRIDILIDVNNKPMMTIEVKRDWGLDCNDRKVVNQAFSYANNIGSPYAIITNGDRYCVFDRKRGLSYEEQFVGSFEISNLSDKGLDHIAFLRKSNISKKEPLRKTHGELVIEYPRKGLFQRFFAWLKRVFG